MAYLSFPPWTELLGGLLEPIERVLVDELGPVRAHLVRVQIVDEHLAVEIVTGDKNIELVEAIAASVITALLPTGVGKIPVDVTVYPTIGRRATS